VMKEFSPKIKVQAAHGVLVLGTLGRIRIKNQESEEKLLLQQWIPAIRVIQINVSIAVTVFILLQVRGAGLGSVFGGSSAGSVLKTRRGVERLIFNITIVLVVLFALVSVLNVVIH